MNILYVAIGGAAGAVLRYLVCTHMTQWLGHAFPYGTMAVNVAGSFMMGVLMALLARSDIAQSPHYLLLAVGVLGGFTTFSAFSLDTVTLLQRGEMMVAAGYVAASVLGSVAALFVGLWCIRMVG